MDSQFSSPLAAVFSTIDSLKRRYADWRANEAEAPAEVVMPDGSQMNTESARKFAELADSFMPGGMIVGAATKLGSKAAANAMNNIKAPGAMPDAIFKQSGAYASPFDKVLRAVVDDSAAIINPSQAAMGQILKPTTVGQMLDHPELFKLYPELKNIKVENYIPKKGESKNTLGSYDEANKLIKLAKHGSNEDLMSTLLHEIQHSVQGIEGMGRGGNPNQFINDPDLVKGALKAASGFHKDILSGQMSASPAMKTTVEHWVDTLRNVETDALESYSKIPGEAEARFTQLQRAGKISYDTIPTKYIGKHPALQAENPPVGLYHDLMPEVQKVFKNMGLAP